MGQNLPLKVCSSATMGGHLEEFKNDNHISHHCKTEFISFWRMLKGPGIYIAAISMFTVEGWGGKIPEYAILSMCGCQKLAQ